MVHNFIDRRTNAIRNFVDALVVGLPWQRLEDLKLITRM